MKAVDLTEKVTVTFYDDEYEEWSQRDVPIFELLESECEGYTVVDVEPIKHGVWEDLHDGCYACSECHSVAELDTPFCPYCGTKMDLDEVEE